MTDLKSRTFNHGKAGKTKKDLEKEAEEKKRIAEEKWVFELTAWRQLIYRAQALVMAEYEEAFERPQYGVRPGRGGGFVRAGGESSPSTKYEAKEKEHLYSRMVGDRSIHPPAHLGDHQPLLQL